MVAAEVVNSLLGCTFTQCIRTDLFLLHDCMAVLDGARSCVELCLVTVLPAVAQVPVRTVFETAPDTLLNYTSARELARNGTQFTFYNIHIVPAELHRLRNTDMASEFKGRRNLFVRFNGAIWDHFIYNAFLWPVAERYGLQKLSKRQVFEMVMRHYIRGPTRKLAGIVARAAREGAPPRLGQLVIGAQLRVGSHKMNDPPRCFTCNAAPDLGPCPCTCLLPVLTAPLPRSPQTGYGGPGAWPRRYQGTMLQFVDCFADMTLRLCRPSCSVFLTSDSEEAQTWFLAAMAGHNISTATYTGDILHLEHNRGHAGQHMKTFADWVALGRVDLMVASRSGFADTASWYSNVPAVTLVQASPCMFASGPELPLGTDPT